MWDLILVGGGLANGLIAWRLRQRYPTLSVLMIESDSSIGGNHTWSFHQQDLSANQHRWISPLVTHAWEGYDVHFPTQRRRFSSAYYTITSAHFAASITRLLEGNLRLNSPVIALTPSSVRLAEGEVLNARAVIDGRGFETHRDLQTGYQVFLGQQWQLAHPHGLERPILMDATVSQLQGYRFIYTLPLTPDTLLIEDTRYADHPQVDIAGLQKTISDYAQLQQWSLESLQREESGCLPITLTGDYKAQWQKAQGQPCSGMRAGLFHPTTGYSLPLAVQLADRIAEAAAFDHRSLFHLTKRLSEQQWHQQRFFRLLNRMLFLAGRPEDRWRVMQRFYGLPEETIARFYAGKLTLGDKARILIGKPPVPPGEAFWAALNKPVFQREKK